MLENIWMKIAAKQVGFRDLYQSLNSLKTSTKMPGKTGICLLIMAPVAKTALLSVAEPFLGSISNGSFEDEPTSNKGKRRKIATLAYGRLQGSFGC